MRIDGSDGEIAEWLRTVDKAGADESHQEKRGKESVTINDTGAAAILGKQGAAFKVGLPGKGKDFEVVGMPLGGGKPGFYVVELASPVLGQALLGRKAPRYVAAAALVTNMAVHFKWGREKSLALGHRARHRQASRRGGGAHHRQLHRRRAGAWHD